MVWHFIFQIQDIEKWPHSLQTKQLLHRNENVFSYDINSSASINDVQTIFFLILHEYYIFPYIRIKQDITFLWGLDKTINCHGVEYGN